MNQGTGFETGSRILPFGERLHQENTHLKRQSLEVVQINLTVALLQAIKRLLETPAALE